MKTIVAYPAFKDREANPYQALLYTEMQRLGWRVLDLGEGMRKRVRADVVHLHWPDGFAFHRGLIKTIWRSVALLMMLGWYRRRGAVVVWTIHNLRSHEGFHPVVESWFWQRFYEKVDGWIALNEFSAETARGMPVLRSLPHAVIPHGLYPRMSQGTGDLSSAGTGALKPVSKRPVKLLLFGKVRPTRELPLLVDAFAGLPAGTAELTIAGKCDDPELLNMLQQKEAEVPGLRVQPRFLPDDELDRLIRNADRIIIPYAGSLNSGAIFLALAYDKVVIVPAIPSFCEIAADFSERQVVLYDSPLSAAKLAEALKINVSSEENSAQRSLKRYQWASIASAHDSFLERLCNEG